MRALVVLVLLVRTAAAELPTIDSEFPPTIRVETPRGVRVERARLSIHAAPEATWLTLSLAGSPEVSRIMLDLDVPDGTRVIGVAINGPANAWSRAMPAEAARSQHAEAKLAWRSASADQAHLALEVQPRSTIAIAMQLPPLGRLAVAVDAGALIVDIDGELQFAQKAARRAVVELSDVPGHVGPSAYPAVDERLSLVAIASAPVDFFAEPPRSSRGGFHGAGDIDKSMIRRRMKAHRPQLRQCFMAVAQWNPAVKGGGTILSFRIDADGSIGWAKATESDLPEAVNDCLAEQVKQWEFPAVDVRIVVNYPLEFHLVE